MLRDKSNKNVARITWPLGASIRDFERPFPTLPERARELHHFCIPISGTVRLSGGAFPYRPLQKESGEI